MSIEESNDDIGYCCSDVGQSSDFCYLLVSDKVVPFYLQDSALITHMKWLQFRPLHCIQGPCILQLHKEELA